MSHRIKRLGRAPVGFIVSGHVHMQEIFQMAELSKGFMAAVKKLQDAKIPVAAQLKDTNAFVQNLDKAQELNEELIQVNKKKDALEKYIDAIRKKMGEY